MIPRAIETAYHGYRFRSRLEARWAVFMDTLGVEYRYEPEGFDLGDGIRYLPDFWLPKEEAWMEVKPDRPTAQEREKVVRLATVSGQVVYVCFGDVWPDSLALGERHFVCHGVDPAEPKFGVWFTDHRWTECLQCGYVGFAHRGDTRTLRCACKKDEGEIPNNRSDRLLAAYQAARSARFEHGESGASTVVVAPKDPDVDKELDDLVAWGEAVADQALEHLLTKEINSRLDDGCEGGSEEEAAWWRQTWPHGLFVLGALCRRRRDVQRRRESRQ